MEPKEYTVFGELSMKILLFSHPELTNPEFLEGRFVCGEKFPMKTL
jgi:hypothetical protein